MARFRSSEDVRGSWSEWREIGYMSGYVSADTYSTKMRPAPTPTRVRYVLYADDVEVEYPSEIRASPDRIWEWARERVPFVESLRLMFHAESMAHMTDEWTMTTYEQVVREEKR